VNILYCRAIALLLGLLAEQKIGWPRKLWHPIMGIGAMIAAAEKGLRRLFPETKAGERAAGILMAAMLPLVTLAATGGLVYLAYRLHWAAGLVLETALCWSIFASGSLRDAAMEVDQALEQGGVEAGRAAVAMIVGRDTDSLTEEGVVKATVETVAENLSDGVVAPMLFVLLLGAPGGYFYKTVNTMDSMVGYKNDRYRDYGTGAARLDDACNFLPSRLSALWMILLSGFCGLDRRNAWRIFRRDRYHHASPNSAQTESVMAGALGVQLAGDAYYFGTLYKKKTIGDPGRPIARADIGKTCRLMLAVSNAAGVLSAILCATAGFGMGGFG